MAELARRTVIIESNLSLHTHHNALRPKFKGSAAKRSLKRLTEKTYSRLLILHNEVSDEGLLHHEKRARVAIRTNEIREAKLVREFNKQIIRSRLERQMAITDSIETMRLSLMERKSIFFIFFIFLP